MMGRFCIRLNGPLLRLVLAMLAMDKRGGRVGLPRDLVGGSDLHKEGSCGRSGLWGGLSRLSHGGRIEVGSININHGLRIIRYFIPFIPLSATSFAAHQTDSIITLALDADPQFRTDITSQQSMKQ